MIEHRVADPQDLAVGRLLEGHLVHETPPVEAGPLEELLAGHPAFRVPVEGPEDLLRELPGGLLRLAAQLR